MIHKIHHVSCGSFCPHGSQFYLPTQTLCCHCLIVEISSGLVLIDTGLPQAQVSTENEWAKSFFSQPVRTKKQSMFQHVLTLGFDPKDVKHILLTHIDWDHAGGIQDFPWAKIHLHHLESLQIENKKNKYRYDKKLWSHQPDLELYDQFGENWNGFHGTRELRGLPSEILFVPLPGHTRGHSGVVLETQEKTLLHVGDAYFFIEDLELHPQKRNLSSDAAQTLLAENNLQRLFNLYRLRNLRKSHPEIQVINSHDPRLLPTL